MAFDLSLARKAAQERGEKPPGGEAPGTPEYDAWVTDWFTQGVAAGDPDLIRRTGGKVAEGGGADDVIADWQSAAPSTEWLGKRSPTPAELRRYAHDTGQSEDYERFSDRQLARWIRDSWKGDHFENDFGDRVEKPTEAGQKAAAAGYTTGEMSSGSKVGSGHGAGGGKYGGPGYVTSGSGFGGAPLLDLPEFKPPSFEEAMADPGYQFALKEGQGALERSAAASGLLRSSGTLKDLLSYGQGMAAKQYGDVYNRAQQTYGTQVGAKQAEFAPLYGSWETDYAGDLSKWTTKYGGELSKYLQKENNIYGLLSSPPPFYGG